jgi:hypothetical protein
MLKGSVSFLISLSGKICSSDADRCGKQII